MMASPGFSVSRRQPRLWSVVTFPVSNSHCTVLPVASSFTSMYNREWGFTQSNFTTVPFSVTGLVESYSAANEWCASTGTAARSRRLAIETTNFTFIKDPPKTLLERNHATNYVGGCQAYFPTFPQGAERLDCLPDRCIRAV